MVVRFPSSLLLLAILAVLASSKPAGWPPSGPGGHHFPPAPPAEFKNVLPAKTFAELTAIHQDKSLTDQQKMAKVQEIMNGLPESVLEKLPLPPEFSKLPEEIQSKLKAVFVKKDLTMQEKQDKVQRILESLPEERQRLIRPPLSRFPPGPPPEFQDVLPEDKWNEMVAIHEDDKLNDKQKWKKIQEVWDSLPDEILEKLPLPPGFDALPAEIQQKARALNMQRGLTMLERHQKMGEIIDSLPDEQRQLLPFLPPPESFPPGPPPDFKGILPKESWDALVAIHNDNTLNEKQKMKKISEVMDALPDSIRGKLPLPPPFRKLPQDVQQKLHAIQIEHGLTMEQRFKKFRQIIESLPPEQKKLLPPPPQARRSGSAPK